MKPKQQTGHGGNVLPRLLLAGVISVGIPLSGFGAPGPAWWSDPSLTTTGTAAVINSDATATDYAAVNAGQVKNIAIAGVNELNKVLAGSGGAGATLNSLKAALSATSSQTQDYAAVNLGQLKTIAKPFCDRLLELGYKVGPVTSGTYPWIGHSASDYAAANSGQVKYLFSFDVTGK